MLKKYNMYIEQVSTVAMKVFVKISIFVHNTKFVYKSLKFSD